MEFGKRTATKALTPPQFSPLLLSPLTIGPYSFPLENVFPVSSNNEWRVQMLCRLDPPRPITTITHPFPSFLFRCNHPRYPSSSPEKYSGLCFPGRNRRGEVRKSKMSFKSVARYFSWNPSCSVFSLFLTPLTPVDYALNKEDIFQITIIL